MLSFLCYSNNLLLIKSIILLPRVPIFYFLKVKFKHTISSHEFLFYLVSIHVYWIQVKF